MRTSSIAHTPESSSGCRHTLDDQPPDLYPIALILTQTMSAYRSLQETFGRVPDSVDDERYIAAWVDVVLAVAARYGLD